MSVFQIIGIVVFCIGYVLYIAHYIVKKNSNFDKWVLTAVVCLLVGFALIAIPAVINPETCSNCEAVLNDTYEFCPECGTKVGGIE